MSEYYHCGVCGTYHAQGACSGGPTSGGSGDSWGGSGGSSQSSGPVNKPLAMALVVGFGLAAYFHSEDNTREHPLIRPPLPLEDRIDPNAEYPEHFRTIKRKPTATGEAQPDFTCYNYKGKFIKKRFPDRRNQELVVLRETALPCFKEGFDPDRKSTFFFAYAHPGKKFEGNITFAFSGSSFEKAQKDARRVCEKKSRRKCTAMPKPLERQLHWSCVNYRIERIMDYNDEPVATASFRSTEYGVISTGIYLSCHNKQFWNKDRVYFTFD